MHALHVASSGQLMQSFENSATPITLDALFKQIPQGYAVTFLIHLDDVGFFESKIDDQRSRKMLYYIWIAFEEFQKRGHFCVMSGQSRLLHIMVKQFNRVDQWQSPCATVLIPLTNLSSASIKQIFETWGDACGRWINSEDNLTSLYLLTEGIPQVVHIAATLVASNPTVTQDALARCVRNACPEIFVRP